MQENAVEVIPRLFGGDLKARAVDQFRQRSWPEVARGQGGNRKRPMLLRMGREFPRIRQAV